MFHNVTCNKDCHAIISYMNVTHIFAQICLYHILFNPLSLPGTVSKADFWAMVDKIVSQFNKCYTQTSKR